MDNPRETGRKNKKADQASKSESSQKIKTRGKFFEGTVVSARMQGTVIVEWPRVVKSGKFNRFYRLSSRVKAKNPEAIAAKEGDYVRIEETRKISKTVNFIVTEIVRKAGTKEGA